VGYQDGNKAYLFNHVNIIVEYHPLDDGSRVVGFYVEPFTVRSLTTHIPKQQS
jgi:hypothetical protein